MDANAAAVRRNALVDGLVSRGVILSKAVETAMRRVARHEVLLDVWLPPADASPAFGRMEYHRLDPDNLTEDLVDRVYRDIPIVTKRSGGRPASSSSQPSLVATMLELLDLRPGMRVLEIGAGTGYNAALISELVGDENLVFAVDIAADVVERTRRMLAAAGYGDISVVCADGAVGYAPEAPYDRIVATVGCTDIAPAWLSQLDPEGFALIPLQHAGAHPLTRVAPQESAASGRVVGAAEFMGIEGVMQREQSSPSHEKDAEQRRPLPPVLAQARGHGQWPGWDALYFLGLANANSGPGLALSDDRGSVAVDFEKSELVQVGDSEHLVTVLIEHVRTWHELGRPASTEWISKFHPIDASVEAAPPAYTIDRLYFRQVAKLL